MKITEWSDRVEQFENIYKNKDLLVSESGVIIHTVETLSGPLRIMIDVAENATTEKLRNAIPLALKWRDNLIEFQGRYGLYEDDSLFFQIGADLKHRRAIQLYPENPEVTYTEVARAINSLLIDWFLESFNKPPKSNPPMYRKQLDMYIKGENQIIPNPIERCRKLLTVLRFSENQVKEIEDECIIAIRNGEVIPDDYPVNRRKLRESLQWFRGKK